MRLILVFFVAVVLAGCDTWPKIDAPPLAEDSTAAYTPFSAPDTFLAPVVEVDPDAPDPEAEVTARASALQARAARLRDRDI